MGLLTLGPTTCKDKLMQAAGRLRKLGQGQTLRIVGTADVTAKIRSVASSASSSEPPAASAGGAPAASSGRTAGTSASIPSATGTALTSQDVLQWVMHNTVQATQNGVLEWGQQGLLFAATRGAPEHTLQPEVIDSSSTTPSIHP